MVGQMMDRQTDIGDCRVAFVTDKNMKWKDENKLHRLGHFFLAEEGNDN